MAKLHNLRFNARRAWCDLLHKPIVAKGDLVDRRHAVRSIAIRNAETVVRNIPVVCHWHIHHRVVTGRKDALPRVLFQHNATVRPRPGNGSRRSVAD